MMSSAQMFHQYVLLWCILVLLLIWVKQLLNERAMQDGCKFTCSCGRTLSVERGPAGGSLCRAARPRK